MAEDESPRSRRTLRRALLAAGRAAALIAIVTGINGLIAPNRPIWGYAVAVFLGGIASGLLTAVIAGVLALIGMVVFFSAPGALGWLSVAIAAIAGGGMVARMTDRPFWRGAVRQLILGAVAAGITYLIGMAVGHVAA